MNYTVTLTDDELRFIRDALDIAAGGTDIGDHPTVRASLDKAKPIAPRKPKASAVPPEFSTGNDRLDAFMRDHWRPSDKVAADKRASAGTPSAKSLAFPFGLKQLTTKPLRDDVRRFNEAALGAWRRLGYEVKIAKVDYDTVAQPALDGRNVTITRPGYAPSVTA